MMILIEILVHSLRYLNILINHNIKCWWSKLQILTLLHDFNH